MMSMEGNYEKKFKIYASQDKKSSNSGFVRLKEEEKFQKRVKKRHGRMKRRLIGLGGQKNTPPFSKKPSYRRSKSAPSGAGGS